MEQRRPWLWAAAAATAVGLASGCESVQSALVSMEKPAARVTSARISDLSVKKATIEFDVEVDNPYAVPLPLTSVRYGLTSEGSRFLTGTADLAGQSVPADGEKVVKLPAEVAYSAILSAVDGIRPGAVVSYKADMTLSVDAPTGKLDLPVSWEGELPFPAVPKVALDTVRWREVALSKATAVLDLRVENPNAFPVDLKRMTYALELGGRSVVESEVDASPRLAADETKKISVPVSFSTADLGSAALGLFRGDGAPYGIRGDLRLGTRFGELRMPYDADGRASFKR